ncbi:phage tail protein [Burkholderia sp. BCC0397]|uniref:phage tail protein n=1 Tax=Burkholderia sp. BCC0397 TaxID=486876 RepID=UPI00158D9355|nr:phage tail protein [Burkholderia sp. BCC0397]
MAVTVLPAAQVVYSPNPLRPAADRESRSVALTGGDTVRAIIDRIGLGGTVLAVLLNGRAIPNDLLSSTVVAGGDMLVIRQTVAGVEASKVAAWAIMQLEVGATVAAVIGATVSFAVGAAIAFVATTILGSLTARRPSTSSGSNDDSPTAFSIEGGSNSARPYDPLLIVLGRHRVFADYGSRPFGEFILDPSTTTEVINATPQTVQLVPPEFGFSGFPPEVDEPWVLIRSDANYDYYGDNAVRSYVTTDGPVTQPHTFVARHSTDGSGSGPDQATTYEQFVQADPSGFFPPQWLPMDTPQAVITRYGYTVTYKTEQLVSIFNYGFGDLSVSDRRVGANDLAQYNAVQLDVSSVPPGQGDRTQLIGYSSPNWPSNSYPGNVQTIEGGALEQHANVLNGGWIERQGSIAARFIQIDISGRLLRQEAGNIANLSCTFEAEYQTPGNSTWLPFPFSPMTITNGSTRIVRETFSAYLDQVAIKVRVRRTTVEPTDANQVSELQLIRIKFFRDGDALYPAQRREGLIIRATGQLNGQVDRLSALVEMKCWVWASNQPWDGSIPGTGNGAWIWQASVNPGFLYLYYARGGFLNASAAPAHLGLAGWLDEPNPTNGERIFGAGLANTDIDYGTLIAWAQWCAAQNLECHLSLADVKSVFTVLNTIAAAGRARMSWAPGKLSVWWEAAGQPSTAAFGASNIVAGTFKIAYDTDESVDGFVMSYTQADNDYQPDEVRATLPGVTQPVNWQSVDAAYSMPRSQAQRLVNLLAAAKHYFRRSITWESTAFGLTVATGDVIQLAHDLTRWAYSGRLIAIDVDAGRVRSVTLSAEVEAVPGDTEFWLMVTPPGADPVSYRCARPVGRTRKVELLDVWSADSAPGWLDASEPNSAASSFYEDTVPEDWTWLAGPAPTPGKRVRIIGTEPSSDRRVRITARDEVAEYYPLEWGLGNVPGVASGERVVARLFNLAASRMADGGQRVTWELDGAVGADVRVAVAGGPEQQVPIAGRLTVVGSELLLPAYARGTRLHIHALPVAAGTPVAIEGDVVDVVVS